LRPTKAGRIEMDKNETPKLKTYKFRILTNPPMYEIALGISRPEYKIIEVQGNSRQDAKEKAGIQ
jgi:hypothetical protein